MTKGLLQRQMTRRTIVSGGLSCAMAWIIPSRLVSDFDLFEPALRCSWNRKEVTRNGNLYAFPGARPESTVIAVTWQELRSGAINDRTKKSKLRIHAGSKSWDFMVGSRTATSEVGQDADIALYIGEIPSPTELPQRMILKAAVISAPNRMIADRDSIGIWAERFESGLRERIGTPFLSTLVAGSDQLACHLSFLLAGRGQNTPNAAARQRNCSESTSPSCRCGRSRTPSRSRSASRRFALRSNPSCRLHICCSKWPASIRIFD